MPSIALEWTVSVGQILTVVGFCLSGIAFVFMMKGDVRVLAVRVGYVEKRLEGIESILKTLADNEIQLARERGMIAELDQRVNTISRRVDSLIDNKDHR